jgi:hypothetical protein
MKPSPVLRFGFCRISLYQTGGDRPTKQSAHRVQEFPGLRCAGPTLSPSDNCGLRNLCCRVVRVRLEDLDENGVARAFASRYLLDRLTACGEVLQSGRTRNSVTLGTSLATKSPQAGPLFNIRASG